jgi:hypothetical protein
MRALVATALLAAGCAASYQSAHVLAPGKTMVTAAVTRMQGSVANQDTHQYAGDIQIRHGIGERFDGGLRLIRTPNVGSASTMFAVDGKYQITPGNAKTALALSVPVGLLFSEDRGTEFDNRGVLIAPTFLVGSQVSATTEVVFGPKIVLIFPDGGDEETDVGLSLGIRFEDSSHTWAVQPEVQMYHANGNMMSDNYYGFGIAISAGN